MKIIITDDFDRDHVPDRLIAENVNRYYANCIIEALNNRFGGEKSRNFFKVVEDTYKLHVFKP